MAITKFVQFPEEYECTLGIRRRWALAKQFGLKFFFGASRNEGNLDRIG